MGTKTITKKPALTKEQKHSIFILSIGTFLEYFDLMLYVHMATLLNDLFFPQTDQTTKQLLTAFAFCSTYLLRPIGGFIIGRIGDKYGRKVTITLTTFVMATACLIMAFTPTYQEIGITATLMIILARVLQGFSSLGEIMGAYLYMAETLKVPYRCVASGVMGLASLVATFFSLALTSIVLSRGINWRYAFAFGAFIAVIGVFARLRLRETPEFVNYQKRIAKKVKENNQSRQASNNNKVNKKAILAYFFTEFHHPFCVYVAYVYLRDVMKNMFGMTPEQITNHNLKVSIFVIVSMLFIVYLVKKIHPIKIAIVIAIVFIIAFPFIPYWLDNTSSLLSLYCFQSLILLLERPAQGALDAIQYKYFLIGKRFTTVATTFGIANPIGYAFVAFGLIPLTHYFGYYALWFVFTPAVVGYIWALYYFRKLEIERGLYYNYPCEGYPSYEDTGLEEGEQKFIYYLDNEYKAFKGTCEYSTQLLQELQRLIKETNKKVNIRLVKKAIIFAKRWHGDAKRNTGEPFYSHPLAVASLISQYYLKTDVIVACILHDTVEDTPCTIELIEKEFNGRIAQMVQLLTKYISTDTEQVNKLTLEQGLQRMEKVKDYEVLFIKEMDRLHNLKTIDGLRIKKQIETAIETTNSLMTRIAWIAEKLNIHEKIQLEDKLFHFSNKILRKEP